MAIDKSKNVATSLTLPKELKALLQELAKEESRSVNSFVLNAIKEYLKNNYPDRKC